MDGGHLQAVARETAAALADVTEGRPFVDKLHVYKVGGRVFLIVTDDPAEQIITVKADPGDGRALRNEYHRWPPGAISTSATGSPSARTRTSPRRWWPISCAPRTTWW